MKTKCVYMFVYRSVYMCVYMFPELKERWRYQQIRKCGRRLIDDKTYGEWDEEEFKVIN